MNAKLNYIKERKVGSWNELRELGGTLGKVESNSTKTESNLATLKFEIMAAVSGLQSSNELSCRNY